MEKKESPRPPMSNQRRVIQELEKARLLLSGEKFRLRGQNKPAPGWEKKGSCEGVGLLSQDSYRENGGVRKIAFHLLKGLI